VNVTQLRDDAMYLAAVAAEHYLPLGTQYNLMLRTALIGLQIAQRIEATITDYINEEATTAGVWFDTNSFHWTILLSF
jgi:hypothetical protein